MSPNQYYVTMPLPMSRQAMTGLEMPSVQELLELNRAGLQAQRNDRYDSFRLDMIGWLKNIYFCLLDGN